MKTASSLQPSSAVDVRRDLALPRLTRLRRWLSNTLLALLGVAVALLGLEGAVRLWVCAFTPNLMTLDGELGWTHR